MAIDVNWLAVVAAMIGAMAIGAIWFSPVLFAKAWMKEMGKTHDQLGSPAVAMVNAAIMYLIAAAVMAVVFRAGKITTLPQALGAAALLWVGFAGSMQLLVDRFRGASPKLIVLTAGNTFLSFLAMGAILALMG